MPVWFVPVVGIVLFVGVLFTYGKLPLRKAVTEKFIGEAGANFVEVIAYFGSIVWWIYYAYVFLK